MNTAIRTSYNQAWTGITDNVGKCNRENFYLCKRFKTRNSKKFIENQIVEVKLLPSKKEKRRIQDTGRKSKN